jgi:cytochrome P450
MEFVTTCAREGGDLVYYEMVGMPQFLVNREDLIEKILVTDQRQFIKGKAFDSVRAAFGNGLVASDGDFWLRQRRLAQPAFHKQRIAGYGEVMVRYARRLLEDWKPGQVRDLQEDMMRLTMEVVLKALFDVDEFQETKRVGKLFETVLKSHSDRMQNLLLYVLPETIPFPSNVRYRKAIKELDEVVYRIINERRTSGKDTGDLLSMLLQAQDADGSRMTDKQLRDEAMVLVFAGHETTALTLTWAFYLLDQYPEVQQKLVEELDRVLGDRLPTVEDLPKLSYTEQIVKETMRLYPPVWVFAREAARNYELEGYHVPQGSLIMISPWTMHRDPRYYSEPEIFKPERWTPEMIKALPKHAYLPFGGGPRLCIGNNFALMEATLVLATLVRQYRAKLAPGEKVEIAPMITIRPKNGLKMVLETR